MIPVQERTSHTISEGGGEEEVMGVSADANDNLFLILNLTNIYSNPLLALGREILTNAWDSHLAAGQTRPVELTFPTAEKPNYVVQDWGVGLTREGVQDTFTYSKSTKRQSTTEVGMFGLGSKAPLAAVPLFNVEAVQDGLKNIAIIKKNDEGRPVRRFLAENVETDEPNGVKITIPIPQKDHAKFIDSMMDMLNYWRGPLLVDGEDVSVAVDRYVESGYNRFRLITPKTVDEIISDGLGNRGNPSPLKLDDDLYLTGGLRTTSKIVMGNVPYPVPNHDVHNREPSFVAWVPVGSVKMTPSRESLEESAVTKATIESIKKRIADYREEIEKKLEAGDTVWDKARGKSLKHEIFQTYFNIYGGYPDAIEDVEGWEVSGLGSNYHTYRQSITSIGMRLYSEVGNSVTAVVNFPFKSVSNNHAAQLSMLPDVKNGNDVLVLRGDVEGMPSIDWSDVPELPKQMKLEVQRQPPKRERKPTLYWFTSEDQFRFQVEKYEGDKRVLFTFDDDKSQVWRTLFPDDVIGIITSQQENRFKRLHPGAKNVVELEAGAVRDLLRKLTKADKKWMNFNSAQREFSTSVAVRTDWKTIKDPVYRDIAKVQPSDHLNKLSTYVEYFTPYRWERHLGLTDDEIAMLTRVAGVRQNRGRTTFDAIITTASSYGDTSRLPLLNNQYVNSNLIEEAILYINAKYKENK